MSEIDKLREDANSRRAEFTASMSALTHRISPATLADSAIGQADPGFAFLRRIEGSVKRNPLSMLAVVAGAWWLISDIEKPAPNGQQRDTSLRPLSSAKENFDGHSKTDER